MRLIDADTVVTIQTYDDMYEEWGAETMTVAEAMDKFSDEGCPPTVDAEPVRHGEWVKMVFTDSGKFAGYKCSECGLIAKRKFSYCHCGAKMDGGKQDGD